MNRLRRWSVVSFVVVIAAGFTLADDQSPAIAAAKAVGDKWLVDRALTITPRAEPEPALKYRLLPASTDLKEGNAVPIYLRLRHSWGDLARKDLVETPQPWNELPLDKVPLAEAHAYLARMSRLLQQFDFGARRKTAEWNYTLEQPDPISILLPDAQDMRGYAPMLVLNARVKVAEGDFTAATRSFATGFAFSRHVANGPFLINSLVGMSIANQMADRVPEWIERPGSPNLYWGLTVLPRPFIDLRKQMELEQQQVELQFPDLAHLDRPRAAAEWDAALKRVRAEIKRIDPMVHLKGLSAQGSSNAKRGDSTANRGSVKKSEMAPAPPTDPDEPAIKSPNLAQARKFVGQRTGKPAAEVAAMPPAQVLLLYIHGTYADLRDDCFKITYLPFPAAHAAHGGGRRATEDGHRWRGSLASQGLAAGRD